MQHNKTTKGKHNTAAGNVAQAAWWFVEKNELVHSTVSTITALSLAPSDNSSKQIHELQHKTWEGGETTEGWVGEAGVKEGGGGMVDVEQKD